MNNINLYKRLAIFGIGLTVIIIVLIAIFAPREKPAPLAEPEPGVDYSYSSPEDIEFREQSGKVAQIIKKLPHQGQYFKLEYFFPSNQFLLTYRKNQENQANAEFDQFLKDNGILSKDWLNNLQINGK